MTGQRVVLVGLGNPGGRYAGTRHNLGRDVLRAWKARGAAPPGVWLWYPPTAMNESGAAVADFLRAHHLPAEVLVVLHDDIELPLGTVQVGMGGSARGHNGVRSVQAALGTDNFKRLRLGVGRPPTGLAVSDFVLSGFTEAERGTLAELTARAHGELDRLVFAGA